MTYKKAIDVIQSIDEHGDVKNGYTEGDVIEALWTVDEMPVIAAVKKDADGIYERMDNGNFQLKLTPYETIHDYEIKPPYDVGDILYVRETWNTVGGTLSPKRYIYKASSSDEITCWKPSIHMPKEAARIFLRVTDIRVERLQEIETWQIVVDEGTVKRPHYTKRGELVLHDRYRKEFAELWNSTINKSDLNKYGWNANPWVWCIAFEKISKEEAYGTENRT